MQDSPFWPLLFPLVFALMWLGVTFGLSRAAGWPELARRFRFDGAVEGERFAMASGSIGASKGFPVGYRNALQVAVNPRGFGLGMFFLFRFMSPPLFIPWADVASVSDQRRWFRHYAEVHLQGSAIRILIAGKAGESLLRTHAQRAGT